MALRGGEPTWPSLTPDHGGGGFQLHWSGAICFLGEPEGFGCVEAGGWLCVGGQVSGHVGADSSCRVLSALSEGVAGFSKVAVRRSLGSTV